MYRFAPWLALLFVGSGAASEGRPGAASAQSLAEVAKKEKDRRARAEEEKGEDASVPVIGNDELARARGDGVSVMGTDSATPPEDGDEPSDDAEEASTDDGARHGLTESQIREYRERWARIWPERLRAAEKELELANDAVFQCQSAAHYVFVPLAVDCNGVFERRAIAEYRVREIKKNRFNWELLLPEGPRPPPSN